MQVIRKIFEYYSSEKFKDLDYGTIYYVAGEDREINDYVLARIDQLSQRINQNSNNWVTCKIVYLNAINPYFNTRKRATLYSPMLPFVDLYRTVTSVFFVAYLDITNPNLIEDAFIEYFRTLQQMYDEVLDTGNYQEYHLQNTILYEPNGGFPVTHLSADDEIRFSISMLKPLPFKEPSRLVVTPYNLPIELPDYNLVFRFGAQVKALYILFLRHPEGIRMKEIADYKEEFKQIYFRVSTRSDMDKLRESVEKLLDVCSPNAMNVKKSQCNSNIRQVIPNVELYRYYVIEAVRGEQHKINIDQSLVSINKSFAKPSGI